MERAILSLATERGVMVLKPGAEATAYTMASHGLLNRTCTCLERAGDGKLVAGTPDFFVQLSADGMEWKTSLEGLKRQHITCLARHPQHSQLVFCGTSLPAVYMSTNHGATWQALGPLETLPTASRWTATRAPYKAKVSTIACHPAHPSVVLAAIEVGGLAASSDGGKTWTNRDQGLPFDVRHILTPNVAGRVYAGTSTGFYRTDNLGGEWVEANKGLPYTKVQAVTMAPNSPDFILMSVSASETGLSALVQSKDGGKSWEMASEGLPRMDDRLVTSLAFGRGGFYAGTNKGDLFGLDNMDGRWTRLGTNYPVIHDIVPLA